jgi:uncharacterized protein (DUF1810 family)
LEAIPLAQLNPPDPFNLQRFLDAQAPVWDAVCAELRAGRKTTHWMWFVFPQLRGLGHSATAAYYAISSLDEARAYLRHETLGPRLLECCRLVNLVADRTAEQIFGYPDYLKFRSSLTLFAHADRRSRVFEQALARYFDGKPDPATLARL